MKPISTSEQLPDAGQTVLWWHPQTKDWRFGPFHTETGYYAPGYFKCDGAWYVCDGLTYWMPEPPPPEEAT